MDGGIDQVTEKVTKWFEEKLSLAKRNHLYYFILFCFIINN